MYLRAKTNKREYKGATGACSGLFAIAPEDNGMVEIGYWRKAYDQLELIQECTRGSYDESGHLLITKDEVDTILDRSKEILATHVFSEDDGYDITPGYDDWGTWNSKNKWEDTVQFFEEAKKIYKEDPNAEIYFLEWS